MNVNNAVKEYYGRVLNHSGDLKTNACCSTEVPPAFRMILSKLAEEVVAKYYGCGLVVPPLTEGLQILDLGCGSGRDVYLLSALAGEAGTITGIDMTAEQLAVARKYTEFHAGAFGHSKSNVRFVEGYIEDLDGCGIPQQSMDLIVSNCVINLSPDKPAVLQGIFNALKTGGELYFSDVFSDRRIPEELRNDPVLYGECLSGAMYTEDFRRTLEKIGIQDYRVVESREITINNPELQERVGNIRFWSRTIRAFNLPLEDRCEDYGQAVIYAGTIPGHTHGFMLDDHHYFETGKIMTVCGNTFNMLFNTRYSKHFVFLGDTSRHYGLFECADPATLGQHDSPGGSCC